MGVHPGAWRQLDFLSGTIKFVNMFDWLIQALVPE
jgi:hypothetical protein